MQLTTEQQAAIKIFMQFLNDPTEIYMKIQGAAGCGKTTLIQYLFETVYQNTKMLQLLLGANAHKGAYTVKLTATTNKAATVLFDLTGYEATTIHSLLQIKVEPNFRTGELELIRKKGTLDTEFWNHIIIIDESSMVDSELFSFIQNYCKNCKIVFIGDKYQLAPVNARRSVMDRDFKYQAELSKIIRNQGLIQQMGLSFREAVKTGIFPAIQVNDQDISWVDGSSFKQEINNVFTTLGRGHINSKILAWTNEKVIAYNKYVRQIRLMPEHYQTGEYVVTNKPIFTGRGKMHPVDSLIRITEVSDEYLLEIPTDNNLIQILGRKLQVSDNFSSFLPTNRNDEKQVLKLLAAEKKWPEYWQIKEHWFDLRDPFAATVYKAQGSTYETVFINLTDIGKCNNSQTVARMLYVAISRASEKVYLFGELPFKYTHNVGG